MCLSPFISIDLIKMRFKVEFLFGKNKYPVRKSIRILWSGFGTPESGEELIGPCVFVHFVIWQHWQTVPWTAFSVVE